MNKKHYYWFKSKIYYNKYTFIRELKGGTFLDIGCGNHSPSITKWLNKMIYYVGVDIVRYNIDEDDIKSSNEIYFFDETHFFKSILSLHCSFDFIMCSHVIEHLPEKETLFDTLKKKLRVGGLCFLSTPNINSINFPSASGTLNYYDDNTHLQMPLTFETIYSLCATNDLRIVRFKIQNTSVFGYILGLFAEPFRKFFKKVFPFTWCYWGFEDYYVIERVR
jgi:2-polyprenyl-3-methyl-5-hydroxy-6-metoxy-1,4-benzoquinol methylase